MSQDWWVLDVMKDHEEATGQDLTDLRARIAMRMRESTGIQTWEPAEVKKVWHDCQEWVVSLRDGSIHPAEVVLCTEDSLAAFSLE